MSRTRHIHSFRINISGILLTTHNVIADDLYVTVTIRTCMFVPKSNNVTQLVYNYTKFITIFADANSLRSVTSLSNERTTSVGESLLY